MPGSESERDYFADRNNTTAKANGKSHFPAVPKSFLTLRTRNEIASTDHRGRETPIQTFQGFREVVRFPSRFEFLPQVGAQESSGTSRYPSDETALSQVPASGRQAWLACSSRHSLSPIFSGA